MGFPGRSARNPQQELFQDPEDQPAEERSTSAREELHRIIAASGRLKGVGIHLYGVSTGQSRISRALNLAAKRGDEDYAQFDIDDAIKALVYLREELGDEKPVEEFLRWLAESFGNYEIRRVVPLTVEERLKIQEEEAAEDAKLLAAIERRQRRRVQSTAALRREYEREKGGSR